MRTRSRPFPALAAALGCMAAPASAQLPSASTAALGMADNFTAAARALNAVAWNPAALALRGGEPASLTLLTVSGSNGIDPITLSDLAGFAGEVVPVGVKQEWLARIEASGGESGSGALEATWAAFHIGRIGFQLASASRVLGDVSPGIARLIMFGNADENGEPRTLDLDGSSFRMHAYSTAAASYAQPIDLPGGDRLSLGVTAMFTWGHLLAHGVDSRGSATTDPLAVELVFPIIETRLDSDSLSLDSGRGFGLDVGAAYQSGIWTFAATVRNIVSTFAWNELDLRYRPLSLAFHEGEATTETGTRPLAEAPAEVRSLTADLSFRPLLSFGVLAAPSDQVLITGDLRTTSDAGMRTGPSRHIGAGLQYRPAAWLPLRLGGAAIAMEEGDTGYQLGAGLGLDLGGISLAASLGFRDTSRLGAATTVMLTLLSTGLR